MRRQLVLVVRIICDYLERLVADVSVRERDVM